jgi:hypothetical protein
MACRRRMPDAEEVKQLLMLDATNVVPCLGAGSSLKVYCDWDELCQNCLKCRNYRTYPPSTDITTSKWSKPFSSRRGAFGLPRRYVRGLNTLLNLKGEVFLAPNTSEAQTKVQAAGAHRQCRFPFCHNDELRHLAGRKRRQLPAAAVPPRHAHTFL